MRNNLTTKIGISVRMTVALLTALALMAGVPRTTMAKEKASDSAASAKADSGKAKSSKAETTTKKTGTAGKEKDEAKASTEDAAAEKMVAELTTAQKKKLLALLNEGDAKALAEISGVGKVRGEAIAKARPFESLEDVRKVKGVGAKVFADVVAHGKTLTGDPVKSPPVKSQAKSPADKKAPSAKSKKSA